MGVSSSFYTTRLCREDAASLDPAIKHCPGRIGFISLSDDVSLQGLKSGEDRRSMVYTFNFRHSSPEFLGSKDIHSISAEKDIMRNNKG